jgi:catechol 2,3-dioxygenase-like lactoylglutathione lyase family enzyme
MAAGLNHVSVSSTDFDASIRFYSELFGAEPIPTPNFGFQVQWLRIGEQQLHLFQREVDAPTHHHFAITVTIEDLERIYERAEAMQAIDRRTFGHHIRELPGDCAQLYLRDPAGNLVEVDALGASRLSPALSERMERLTDVQPQGPENQRATLFLQGDRPVSV